MRIARTHNIYVRVALATGGSSSLFLYSNIALRGGGGVQDLSAGARPATKKQLSLIRCIYHLSSEKRVIILAADLCAGRNSFGADWLCAFCAPQFIGRGRKGVKIIDHRGPSESINIAVVCYSYTEKV